MYFYFVLVLFILMLSFVMVLVVGSLCGVSFSMEKLMSDKGMYYVSFVESVVMLISYYMSYYGWLKVGFVSS